MEKEENIHLPFLDIDIYRKTVVFDTKFTPNRPTQICTYINSPTTTQPTNTVLSYLIHRARALCDQDSLSQQLDFLTITFKQNGYNDNQIQRAMKPAPHTPKPDEKPTTTAYFPYITNTWTPQPNAGKI
jgi:hypothetical protein